MKKIFFNKLSSFAKITALVLFLAAGFFGFGALSRVYAACHYTIETFSVSKTTALPTDTLTFQAEVSTKADRLNECTIQSGKENIVELWINFDNYHILKDDRVGSKVFTLTTDINTLSSTFTVDLRKYNLEGLSPANQMQFQLIASSNGWKVAESNITTVYLSGSTGSGSGAVRPTISINPKKDVYQSGESIQIFVYAEKSQVDNLNSGITDIFIQPVVNGKNIDGFTVKRAALANSTQYKDTQVSSANGFKDGQNAVAVSLWQAGTDLKLGEGAATLNAGGIVSDKGTPPTDEGKGTPPTDEGKGTPPTDQKPAGVDCVNMDPKSDDYAKSCLYNPLPTGNLTDMLLRIMKGFLAIVAAWAVAFIVIGGFRMVMAQGNEEAYTTAKKTITWAVMGLVIALLSFAIVAMVQNFLGVDIKEVKLEQKK